MAANHSETTEPLKPPRRRVRLTRAEGRVLAFAAAGYDFKETAQLLGVAPETVKRQRASVLRKLAARNTVHAVAIVAAHGKLGAETLARVDAFVEARR